MLVDNNLALAVLPGPIPEIFTLIRTIAAGLGLFENIQDFLL